MGSIAIGGLIAHCIFFWGPFIALSLKHARDKTQPDPHWIAMQKYDEAPWWWYLLLLLSAFFAGKRIMMRYLQPHLRQRFRLGRSYMRAQRRDDASCVVVHRSAHLGRNRGPVLDASFCPHGQRNCHRSALQDDCGRHQPWKASFQSLCEQYNVLSQFSFSERARFFLVLNVEQRRRVDCDRVFQRPQNGSIPQSTSRV